MTNVTDAANTLPATPATDRSAAPPAFPRSSPLALPADLEFFAARTGDGSAAEGIRPLVLVFPGGCYSMHAEHEGAGAAEWLAEIGLNALVVRYPLAPERHPAQLRRAREVLAGVRSGALELTGAVDRSRIAVLGFSAGGHLAALLSSLVAVGTPNTTPNGTPVGTPNGTPVGTPTGTPVGTPAPTDRPDLTILGYPVISLATEPHAETVASLLGEGTTPSYRRSLSAENLVDDYTPPTFLWHTADDGGVPVSHSLRYASALAAHNVPFDLHVFELGEHGKGLARGLGPLELWTVLCEAWLEQRGWIEANR